MVHPIEPVEHKSSTAAAQPHRPVRLVTIAPFAPHHHRTDAKKVINARGRP